MPLRQIPKEVFRKNYENSLAIVEADYGQIYFRYFITQEFCLGIAITYRYDAIDPIREYYEIDISPEVKTNLTSAYLFICSKDERDRIINSEVVKIFNKNIEEEFQNIVEKSDNDQEGGR